MIPLDSLFKYLTALTVGLVAPLIAYVIPKLVAKSAAEAQAKAAEAQALKQAEALSQQFGTLEAKVNSSIDEQREAIALWMQTHQVQNATPNTPTSPPQLAKSIEPKF